MKNDKVLMIILNEFAYDVSNNPNYSAKKTHDEIVKRFVSQTKEIRKDLRECRKILNNPDLLAEYIGGC